MKGLRHAIRSFFGFSRTQTNGFVALVLIMTVALFSRPFYHSWFSSREADFSKEKQVLDSLTAQWELEQRNQNTIPLEAEVPVTLFGFNPNTITADELQALGFSVRLSKGLLNYRSKGGSFRIKSDLKKLYGMDSAFYKTLYPFIQLPEKITYSERTPEPKRESVQFNINEADTTQLQSVYGIGKVLAKRIITYREKLGGFVKPEQLKEVYGLDSAAIQKLLKASFLKNDFQPQKININTADEKVLSSHPYFSKKIARAIVTYRFQHGKFKTIEDLRRIELIDSKTADKIYPYVTVE